MFRFEHIEYLYLLIGLAPLIGLFILFMYWRKKALSRFGENSLIAKLMPAKPRYKHLIKFILLAVAYVLIVFGLANPQLGTKFEKVKRQGVDIIVAIDVSKSMLADDVKPNRLERSVQLVSKLIDKLSSDRVGMIVFAGNAYLQMPVTVDYSAAKLFLKTVNTNTVPTQGTAIGDAIRLSMEAFKADEKKFKTLIIISDGENHEGDALKAVDEAVESGVIVHAIGVGSPKGAPIPVKQNGVQVDYKRDKSGNIVLSKLNETMMQQLAAKGNGSYFRLTTGSDELEGIFNAIATMEKKDFEEQVVTDYDDHFQYFIMAAFLLLILEFFIAEKRSIWLSQSGLFK